jgi:hypothetical protein
MEQPRRMAARSQGGQVAPEPAGLPRHEVRKVDRLWLSVDPVRDMMGVRKELSPHG